MVCPKCNAQLPPGAILCGKCGTKFKTKTCPHCKAAILSTLAVCPHCHLDVNQPTSVAKAQAAKNRPQKSLQKQWWFWAVCAVLVIGIIGNVGNALNGKHGSGPKASSSSVGAAPTPEPESTNVFLKAAVQEADVMNGIKTEKIGVWAYINMKKADAKAASPENYAEFARDVVNGSGYNWFSIIFEDQTGINFTGCYTYIATYGKLDDEGCVTEAIGDITLNTKTGKSAYQVRKAEPTPEPATPEPTEAAPTASPTPAPTPVKAVEEEPVSDSEPTPAPTQKPAATNPPAVSTPKPEAPSSSEGHTIYVTKSGDHYHYDNHCNGGTYYESTLEEALARDLTPCKKCIG